MPEYRVWIFQNQRQVQVANTLAMLIASCVEVNLRLIDIKGKYVRTDRQSLQLLKPARGCMCHSNSNKVFQSTHYRSSRRTLPAPWDLDLCFQNHHQHWVSLYIRAALAAAARLH